MDKERNIKNAITLLDAILNNWKRRNKQGKEYYIFFPKFSTDENKLTALFPVFEKNANNSIELAAWGEYDLETYTLSQYIAEEKEIVISDEEVTNYKDKKFEDLLEAFVKIFYAAQSFKKYEEGSAEYKENKKNLINVIYDYEDMFINDITDELNDVYGIEYDEEEVEVKQEPEPETVVEQVEDEVVVEDEIVSEDEIVDEEDIIDEDEIIDEEDIIEEEIVDEEVEEVEEEDEFANLVTDATEENVVVEDEPEPETIVEQVEDEVVVEDEIVSEDEIVDEEDIVDEDEIVDEEDIIDEDEIVDEEVIEEVEEEDEFANLVTDAAEEENVVVEDEPEPETVVEQVEDEVVVEDEIVNEDEIIDEEDIIEEEIVDEEVVEEVEEEDEFANLVTDAAEEENVVVEDETEPETVVEQVEDEIVSEDEIVDEEDVVAEEEIIEEEIIDEQVIEEVEEEDEFANLVTDATEEENVVVEDESEPETIVEQVEDEVIVEDEIVSEDEIVDEEDIVDEDEIVDEEDIIDEDEIVDEEVIEEIEEEDEFANLVTDATEEENVVVEDEPEPETVVEQVEDEVIVEDEIVNEEEIVDEEVTEEQVDSVLNNLEEKLEEVVEDVVDEIIKEVKDEEDVEEAKAESEEKEKEESTLEYLFALLDEFTTVIASENEDKKDIEEKSKDENTVKEEIIKEDEKQEEQIVVKNNKNEQNEIKILRQQLLEKENKFLERKERIKNNEYKLKKFDPFKIPVGSEIEKYTFDWEKENGLKYISDKSLKIAYTLIEKGDFSLSTKIRNNHEQIIISSKVMSFCSNTYTTDELLNALDMKQPKIKERYIFETEKNDYYIRQSTRIEKGCYNCDFEKCPKLVTGYVLYLRNTEKLEEKLKEREEFRKNNAEINDYYAYVWEPEDGLKNIPQKIYEYAEELADRNCVYVSKSLDESGCLEIHTPIECTGYKLIETEKESLNYNREFSEWTWISRYPMKKLGLCRQYTCRLDACPIMVAGYIHYLKSIGRDDIIIADRKYYLNNKEKIDLENEELKANKIKEIEIEKNDYVENLKREYEDKIHNLNDFIDIILNPSQKNLHCTLESRDNIGKEKFILEISNILNKVGKTNSNQPYRISLQNLASSNAYSYTHKGNTENKDLKGILYQTERAMKYTELIGKRLHVIDGITEFVEDYKVYKSNGTNEYLEIRRRQFDHIIELLTKMNLNNYIILDGTEKEINELLELEPRLQFVYKNHRFKIPELSIDEMYNIYMQTLKPELLTDIRANNEEYKKQFIEYISLNKNFIPLSDRELANYLATYSNSKNEVVFPENIYKKETIEESLKNIIGLESVKNKVAEFEKYMLFQMKAKAAGLNLNSTNMHMIFTGNPGTGKTTIARIMAKMLFDLGIIKESKLIEVERKDLIANYIGQTATKTSEVISKAMGGVLFIDEAYELAGKGDRDFGLEAIATLIKAMEDHKDEFVVIFAGYKNEMKTFIDSNPGIASRIGYTFDFPDYSPEELIEIFNKKMNNMGFEVDESAEVKLNSICKYFSKRKAFGNGRFVDKLIQEVIMKHSKAETENIKLITKDDIPEIEDLNNNKNEDENKETKELLNNIIGMESLKEKILEFEEYVSFLKEAENLKLNIPNQNMHMVFTGNPGTGKTTIARIMAKMLRDLGIIHENKLIEVERKDLIAEYIGQTAIKTSQVIERAMGGVLFIDEAYSLASPYKNDFGHEAITTLIKAMEDHKGEFVVIFAGYKEEMKGFIETNPGIASRIGYTFDFPDYTDTELAEILYTKIEHAGMTILKEAKEPVEKIMKYFCNVENIGNGRFVDKVLQEILMKHAKNKKRKIGKIQKADIPTIKEMTDVIFSGTGMIDVDQITDEDLKKTAVHEVGHACIRLLLFKEPGIKKITINPEGTGALGYVRHSGNSSYTSSKTVLLNNIKVLLAGMVAEQVYFGEFGNGNTSDLEKASTIAKNMISRYGMSDLGFGQIVNPDGVLAQSVQNEINKILKKCFDETAELITNNRKKMDKVVDYLLEHKEIDEEDLIKKFK